MPDYPAEITLAPWTRPPELARVRVPGSKSLTNRALVVAALAKGPSTLTGALDSDDTSDADTFENEAVTEVGSDAWIDARNDA